MRLLSTIELAAIGLLFLSLAQRTFWPGAATVSWSFVGAGILVGLLAFVINPMRWQLAPAGIVALIVLTQTIISTRSGDFADGLGIPLFVTGATLLALSAVLVRGFPAGPLPAPGGPYKVGVAAAEIERRVETPDRPGTRRLLVKIWYPAAANAKSRKTEPLWNEIHELQEIPAIARALLAYLKRVHTHSIEAAPIATRGTPFPVLVYNHSLLSIAAENTLLMEWLASRGYAVLSIRHRDQADELALIRAGTSKQETARDNELYAKLRRNPPREERARLSLELYRNGSGMSTLVHHRAADSTFVLDNLDAVLASIPGQPDPGTFIGEQFGAFGLSLGGAVSTQLCLTDQRCAGVVNLDGGLYGIEEQVSLPRPYLMIYSEDNAGSNDAFAGKQDESYQELVLDGAKHLNLHDAATLFPILTWIGMIGPASSQHTSLCIKQSLADFFDRAMQDADRLEPGCPRPDPSHRPS